MSESQLAEIRLTWQIACDHNHPDNGAAINKLLFIDMPAILSYAQVEVQHQTALKLEVLERIHELSQYYVRIPDTRIDTTVHATVVGEV